MGGTGVTLATDNLANTTIDVQGNTAFGNATLAVPDGLVNHGTLLLESLTNGYTDTLALAGTFTNAADGVIQANPGSGGGPRTISGTLINAGTINVDTNTTLGSTGANFINTGVLTVAAGATLNITGDFTQATTGVLNV